MAMGSRRVTSENIVALKENEVFVFGSNSTGFHGAGASGYAFRNNADMNWRGDEFFKRAMNSPVGSIHRIGKWAIYGVARGFQAGKEGKSYAIETIRKPGLKRSTPLVEISHQIEDLYRFATKNPNLVFLVTAIGCNLAGYTVLEIKDIFQRLENIPENIVLPREFEFRNNKSPPGPVQNVDGVDHINIYSRGRTELGRLLSNFARTPFECVDGRFESIEGYWYWLKLWAHPDREILRNLYGFEAKKIGKELSDDVGAFAEANIENFEHKIKLAIEIKIKAHHHIGKMLMESSLPLEHYYVYADKKVDAGYKWIIHHIEELRTSLKS